METNTRLGALLFFSLEMKKNGHDTLPLCILFRKRQRRSSLCMIDVYQLEVAFTPHTRHTGAWATHDTLTSGCLLLTE
jgi:hypothetical protein